MSKVDLSGKVLRQFTYTIHFDVVSGFWHIDVSNGTSIEHRILGDDTRLNALLSDTRFSYLTADKEA